MRLLPAVLHPKTWGLDHRTDLTDPDAIILDVAKVLPYNRATMVAYREEVVVEGTLLVKGVTKTMGLKMTRGVAIAPTTRAIPVTMGEIPGTDPSWRHAPPGAIPIIW